MSEQSLAAESDSVDVGTLFSHVRLGLAVLDPEGRFLSVNPVVAEFLDRRPHDLLGEDASMLVGDDLERLVSAETRTVARTRLRSIEREGRTLWLEVRAGPVRDRQGDVTAVVCLVTDVTARVVAEESAQRTQRQLRLLLEETDDVVMVLDGDADVLFTSPSEERLLGYARERRIGRSLLEIVPDVDRTHVMALFDRVCAEPAASQPITVDLRHVDGSVRQFTGMLVNRLDEPAIGGVVLSLRDVSATHLLEAAERSREQRFRQLVEDSPHATLVVADRQVLFANHAAARLLGAEHRDVLLGRRLSEWLGEDALAALEGSAENGDDQLGTQEVRVNHPDGSQLAIGAVARRVEFAGRDALQIVAWDITAQKQTEADLVYRAAHDELTGLPNRHLLADRIERSVARRLRDGGETAVMVVDLDRFKEINDAHGHAAGDSALLAVAQRLERVVRPTDTVARLGGDEFVIVCEVARSDEAGVIAERVVRTLERPITVEGVEVVVGASVGVALTTSGRTDAPDLLRAADRAMFDAKHGGRGQWRLLHELEGES